MVKLPFRVEGWGTPNVAIRRASSARPTTQSGTFQILYTRGDELVEPGAYRGAFEQALTRNLLSTGDVSDDAAQRAFAVSMTAYACTEYRAGVTGGIPLEVLNGVKGADETPLEGTPLDFFIDESPRLLADWVRSHLIFGRTYLRKRYNTRGYPTGLQWLNPLDVYEITAHNLVTGYRWTTPTGGMENLQLNEVIYSQAFDARSYGNGLSKFEAAWLALNIEASLATFAAAFFVNGAQIDGFLSFDIPLTPEQLIDARNEWRANHQGVRKSHKTSVMPGGAKWNPISAVPKDLAMSELKQAERQDICAVFETDPALVHLTDVADPLSASSTYSAKEIGHVRDVTLPFLRMVVLPALNEQWAMKDFGAPYRIDVNEQRVPALVEAQFVRADTAINVTGAGLLDYDEGRALMGYAPRDNYLARKPDDALALWNAGAATLNDVHVMVAGASQLGVNGDVVQVGGQLYPVARLMEVANANVETLKTAATPPPSPGLPFGSTGTLPPPSNGNGGVSVTTPPQPQLPSGGTAQSAPVERDDDHSLCAMLFFQPNDPVLLSLQNRLREIYVDGAVKWTPTNEFHVTLFYAPDVTDIQAAQFAAALSSIPTPDIRLGVGSLHSFDNLGEHALHFRIKRSQSLLDYQEAVFDAAQGMGILASPYSAPDSYTPHITMGYVGERAKAVTYSGKAEVRPNVLRLMYGDTCVHERPLVVEQSVQRGTALPLQLAVDLSGNQFVRYARRILSDALTAQGISAEWVDEDAWRMVLAQADDWTPADLSALIKRADYADVGKADVRLSAYEQHEGGLYVLLDHSPDTLAKGAALDLRAAGLTPGEGGTARILLATTDAEVGTFPPVDFPIVLNNVTTFVGDSAYHAWSLRSASPAELRELTNWQHVVARKGRDYDFHVEALPDGLRDFVRERLASADGLDDVFQQARALLVSGESVERFLERWDESQHPRQPDGKFGDKGGGGSSGNGNTEQSTTPPSKEQIKSLLPQSKDQIPPDLQSQFTEADYQVGRKFSYGMGDYLDTNTCPKIKSAQKRAFQGGAFESEDERRFAQKAADIEAGLEKLPKYDGTIYRGLNLKSTDQFQGVVSDGTLTVGSIIQNESLTSFTRDRDMAQFVNRPVVMRVQNNRAGVAIESLSPYAHEREVLAPSGTTYRVTGIQPIRDLPDGDELKRYPSTNWVIDVEEVAL